MGIAVFGNFEETASHHFLGARMKQRRTDVQIGARHIHALSKVVFPWYCYPPGLNRSSKERGKNGFVECQGVCKIEDAHDLVLLSCGRWCVFQEGLSHIRRKANFQTM